MSIVIPVGLFTSLKFAGIGQPPNLETITLDPVSWQFRRTNISGFVRIDKFLNASYTDSAGQMRFSVYLGTYVPPDTVPYSLQVAPSFSATPLSKDFTVVGVVFSFGRDIHPSLIDVEEATVIHDNLSLKGYSSGQLAYVQCAGNSPSVGVDCWFLAWWYLSFTGEVTFSREITCSVTYFNGSVYRNVIQPFDLTLLGS
jgi:hypothetical protein